MNYSSAFNKAFADLLPIEGKYSDDPSDPGGATNYGLSTRFLEDYYGRAVPKDEVRAMTVLKAKEIYAKAFWYGPYLHNLPDEIAAAVFDQGVNRGPETAIKMLQKVIGADVDGFIGPQTILAAHAMAPGIVIRAFCREAASQYVRIAQNTPSSLKYLGGWINRVFSILERHNL